MGECAPTPHVSQSYLPLWRDRRFRGFLWVRISITHLDNVGAAWGTLGDYPHFLIGLRIALDQLPCDLPFLL